MSGTESISKTFCERLRASCESHSDRVAMRIVGVPDETFTYGQTFEAIAATSQSLEQCGVNRGDRVALIGENHPCWAMAYLGIIYHGAVCVPIDPHGEIETVVNFLENSESKVVFISPDVKDRFRQIRAKLNRPITAVVWRDAEHSDDFIAYETWLSEDVTAERLQRIPQSHDEDIALLMYTSGTTGVPKGVPLTHGNIVSELDGINRVLEITEEEKILSLLPLFHAYLQIANLWIAFTKGCEVGYLKELTPQELSDAMKEFKPTMLGTVPRLWYLFHKKIFDAVEAQPKTLRAVFRTLLRLNGFTRDVLGINLGPKLFKKVHDGFGGHLVRAISAGSRFDAEVAIDFHRLGFTILQGYGLTETSGAATATYESDNKVGSVGKPLFNSEIKIANPDNEGIGEVLIRGPIVFGGYYKNPDATRDAFTEDGWFRSGDLGRMDSDGHLFIVGRAKDVIVLPNGKNVHPEDLEVHYLKSQLVAELAVLGVEDPTEKRAGAEKLVAVVVPDFEYLKTAKIANSREAIRFELDSLGRELPEYQRVRDYIIRAEPLPRTATRKIRRFELRKEILSGTVSELETKPSKEWIFSDSDNALMESPVGRSVASVIRNQKEGTEIVHPEQNLELDLGLDSLARAEVFAALEQGFNIEIDSEEAARALLVKDVIALVTSRTGEVVGEISVGLNWSQIVKESSDDIPEVKGILKPRPLFSLFAFVVLRFFRAFCAVFMRLEVSGTENLRKIEGPFLICPNHQSFLDAFVVCCTYPKPLLAKIFHVGASEFFEGAISSRLAKMLNVVPIDPDTQLMKAMKAGAMGLRSGKVLNIYPEGERGFDGKLHPFKKGAAILATELDLPIVPVAIDGLFKVWPRNTMRIRPAKVKIRFGAPMKLGQNADGTVRPDDFYEAATARLKEAIAEMVDDLRK